jgi:hypothetical protein
MADDIYTSRGKGHAQIARDSERLLEAAIHPDVGTGQLVLTAADIEDVLDRVDDRDHFADPMALALLRLVLSRGATIVVPPPRAPARATQ